MTLKEGDYLVVNQTPGGIERAVELIRVAERS